MKVSRIPVELPPPVHVLLEMSVLEAEVLRRLLGGLHADTLARLHRLSSLTVSNVIGSAYQALTEAITDEEKGKVKTL